MLGFLASGGGGGAKQAHGRFAQWGLSLLRQLRAWFFSQRSLSRQCTFASSQRDKGDPEFKALLFCASQVSAGTHSSTGLEMFFQPQRHAHNVRRHPQPTQVNCGLSRLVQPNNLPSLPQSMCTRWHTVHQKPRQHTAAALALAGSSTAQQQCS